MNITMPLLEEQIVGSRPENKRKLDEVSEISLMPRKHHHIVSKELTIDASATHKAALAEETRLLKSSSSTDSILKEFLKGDNGGQDDDTVCTSNTKVTESNESPLEGRSRSSKKGHVRFTDSPTSITVYINGPDLSEDEEKDSNVGDCVAGLSMEMGDVENVCTKVVIESWEQIENSDNLDLRKRQLEMIRALLRKFS